VAICAAEALRFVEQAAAAGVVQGVRGSQHTGGFLT
jgi:hypothetical protein